MVDNRQSSGRGGLGVLERQVTIDGHVVNYAEGPANGPKLVLLHGQGSRWQDHAKVLPTITRTHHVFAVDVPGHGGSGRLPADDYTNRAVANLLATFMSTVVAQPAIVSGHSSGGLLALALAAHHPQLVSGLLLEDPPLFSSELPRAEKTTGAVLMRLAAQYLRDRPDGDFQRYYVANGEYFAFFGPFQRRLVTYSLNWIDRHPGRPLRIFFLPPIVNVYFEGLVHYDPVFGVAWDDGTWYRDFDTESALAAVDVPVTLIHTDWWYRRNGTSYSEDGVLMAAMDVDDRERAVRLLTGVAEPQVETIASGHLVHFERPKEYLAAVMSLTARVV
ncbi:pimeloyl-ACP methyl ester carboxylesterase [Stackebrandtia endophytica]|uniref:Pimeloyl-ACP methyl ester carboxylesterase n=1 Tax=Stackebrandtia endophytica TaxID=1496996 RepID=A0A543ATP0_9ACTN|nr:alpha/beta hydrolase [Stackebrandtia endophytica]TQL75963.1 pimeloyl-ACP methyl ester carboxylesterase [Stackebrandtia endophytica]